MEDEILSQAHHELSDPDSTSSGISYLKDGKAEHGSVYLINLSGHGLGFPKNGAFFPALGMSLYRHRPGSVRITLECGTRWCRSGALESHLPFTPMASQSHEDSIRMHVLTSTNIITKTDGLHMPRARPVRFTTRIRTHKLSVERGSGSTSASGAV
jgi:hypothetical protein